MKMHMFGFLFDSYLESAFRAEDVLHGSVGVIV